MVTKLTYDQLAVELGRVCLERDAALSKLAAMESQVDKPAVAVPIYQAQSVGGMWLDVAECTFKHHEGDRCPNPGSEQLINWIAKEAEKGKESTKDWPEWRKKSASESDAYSVNKPTLDGRG